MSQIEFDEDKVKDITYTQSTTKGLSGWLVHKNVVKNVRTANLMLIGLVLLLCLIMVVTLTRNSSRNNINDTPIRDAI
ncbi:MAG: hypothetical protein AUK16_00370 [Parcubacteria group bacterium CG2_30_44_11]|nr:MAG: hypothetical protein AUK16_00370 [Parcubacteria group bacterium CG2_30_44_11]